MSDVSKHLPLIRVFPRGTPTDAELEAQRDKQHEVDVAMWIAKLNCDCLPWACHCDWPVGEVRG